VGLIAQQNNTSQLSAWKWRSHYCFIITQEVIATTGVGARIQSGGCETYPDAFEKRQYGLNNASFDSGSYQLRRCLKSDVSATHSNGAFRVFQLSQDFLALYIKQVAKLLHGSCGT